MCTFKAVDALDISPVTPVYCKKKKVAKHVCSSLLFLCFPETHSLKQQQLSSLVTDARTAWKRDRGKVRASPSCAV